MNDFFTQNELMIRLLSFAGIFVLMAVSELIAPKRALSASKSLRWANNIALVVLNSFVIRLLFPAAAVGVAVFAKQQGWGVFNYCEVPLLIGVVVSFVALDLIVYFQHVLVHAVPGLWRLHRVHHADPDFDVTTGSRFHPLEIIFSMLIKFAAIIVLGAPVVGIVLFEVVLNASSMFNHSNVALPVKFDRYLRWLIVTPDMHRVHHSVEDDEANSNFGFNLPWWDRIFGTYRDQPRAGHKDMVIGIHYFNTPAQVSWLPGMLVLPFIGKITAYAINRRNWGSADEK